MPPARTSSRGFSLVEIVILLAVLSILASAVLPAFFRSTARLRLSLAAREVASVLRVARLYAVRHNAKVAVKFTTESNGRVTFSIFRDGDGDGVRNRDIDAGTDLRLTAPRRLAHLGSAIRFGFPVGAAPRDPSTGRPMTRLEDPIRFNRSDLASFSPMGAATPGSVYLSDQRSNLVVVRVTSRTGRVRVLRYDYETEVWSPM